MGILGRMLGAFSGNKGLKVSEQLLFDKVIGFRGVVSGCGTSTIVQNVAIALSEKTNFNICVLDTNYMYPIQYPLLTNNENQKENSKDILDYNGDVSEIIVNTNYKNVYLAHLSQRTIFDLLSSKDNEKTINKVIGGLKSFFDVILVDISQEPTNVSIHAAIKCNRIYQVADSSMQSIYHLKKSINTIGSLAIPIAKANKVILNKQFDDIALDVKNTFDKVGMLIVGEIPFSREVAIKSSTGNKIYGALTKDNGITVFNQVLDRIVEDIARKTPMNKKYFDINERIKKEKEQTEYLKEHGDEIIDTAEVSVDIIEEDYVYSEETEKGDTND